MRKNKAKTDKTSKKEYKKRRFFAMDDDYEDEEDSEKEDDDGEDDVENDGDAENDGDVKNDDVENDEEEEDDEEDDAEEDDEEDDDDDDDEEDDDDEDNDEEDDDEEDDDDDDDSEDIDEESGWNSEGARRARRKARRIRNQILAYLLIAAFVLGVLGGCFLGGRKMLQTFNANKQEQELEDQLDALQKEEAAVDLTESTEQAMQEPQEEVTLSPLDEIVTARIAEMPIEDKVAALFMVTPEQLTGVSGVTKAGDKTKEALMNYKVGGLVYTDSNIANSGQLKELLKNTLLLDQTLFLAVNEEGGKASVIASELSMKKTSDMAAIESADGAYQAGSDIGTYLAEYGFNLDLAPVADVKVLDNSILGNRSFGTDPGAVGEKAASYIRGLTEKGVSACVKMFPGLGGVTESTAAGMADTQRSQSDMEAAEFPAYQTAIAAGSEFVMVGTMSAPNLVGDNTPCCLTPSVIELLRSNLGFNGVIVTGALNETAITDYYTSAEAAEKALRAGADMLYMPQNFKDAYNGLLQAVESGSLEESRIDESLLRIYRVKYKDKVGEVLGEGE